MDDQRPEEPTSLEGADCEYQNKEMETPGEHSFTVFPFLSLFAFSLSPLCWLFSRVHPITLKKFICYFIADHFAIHPVVSTLIFHPVGSH